MGQDYGYNNVADDDEESLVFADEGEDVDVNDDEEDSLTTLIAWMIADTFGRSAIDADFELATAIIERVTHHPLRADTNS